ncbi:hypothetical protein WJX72_004758 [[Myrmecia] bisecta]|uniref:RING-type domain-containing protein n=1 Tax=[Myrmecia] bisecta TaxID=41462 RepID=A0AAW1P6V5_9CHLO
MDWTNSEEMTELFKRRHRTVPDVDLLDLASPQEEATTYWAGGPDPIISPGRDQMQETAHGGAAAECGNGGVNGPGAAAEARPASATGDEPDQPPAPAAGDWDDVDVAVNINTDVPDTRTNGLHGGPAQRSKRAQQRPSVDVADVEEGFDSEDKQLARAFLDASGTAPDEDAERRSRADHELRQVYLSDILLCLQELHASNLLTSGAMLAVGQVLAQALPGRRVEGICLQDIEALGCDALRQLLVGVHTMLGLRCRVLHSYQQMESIAASMKPQMHVRDGKVSLTRTALEHELREALEAAQQAQQAQRGSSSKAGAAAKQPTKAGSALVETLEAQAEAWLGEAGQAAFVDALYLAPAGTEPAKAGAHENGAPQGEEGVAARLKCAQRLLVEGALHAEMRSNYLTACRRTFEACLQFRFYESYFKGASNGRQDMVAHMYALLKDGIDAVSELRLLTQQSKAKTLRMQEHRAQQRIHKLQAELERWEEQRLSQDDSLSSYCHRLALRERQTLEAAVKRQRHILQGLKEETDTNNAGLDGPGQQLFQLSKGTAVVWSTVQAACQTVAEALENGKEMEALVVMGGSFAPDSRLGVALQAALLDNVTVALDAAHQHALSVDIAQIAARKAVIDAVWMSCRDLGTELRPAFRSVLTQQLSQAARQEQAARAMAIEDELMNGPAETAPKGSGETKKAAKGKAKKKDKAAKAAEEDRLRRERETREEEEREAEEAKRREEEAEAERLRKEQEDTQAQHAALMEMQAEAARKAAAQQAQAEAEARHSTAAALAQQLSQAARQEQAARAKAIEDELMNDAAEAASEGSAETKKAAKRKAKKKDKAAKAAEEDRLRRERENKEGEEREAEEAKRVEATRESRENVRERDERTELLNTYQQKYDQLQHQWTSMKDHCAELEHKVQTMEREQAGLQQQLQQSEAARAAATEQTVGQWQLLAKLKEYQEKLAAEKRRSHQLALDAAAAGGAGSGSDQAGISAAQLKAVQEEANARECQLRQQLACLKGNAAALKLCSLPQLRSLESHVENAWKQIRTCLAASTEQELRKRESALRALARAAEESATCSLCMDQAKSVVLNCGHQACQDCSQALKDCPFCRAPITNRITLFKT